MTDRDTFSCLYLPLGNNMKISKKGRLFSMVRGKKVDIYFIFMNKILKNNMIISNTSF